MAYPEPIPEIKGRNAREFIQRLENFELTEEQKELCRGASKFYKDVNSRAGSKDD